MKLLIQNYTSVLSTEPMYLDACLKKTESVTSNVWNVGSISAFDILDKLSPNVLLCHYTCQALNDVLKYFAGNKNMELVLNITGIQQDHFKILENLLDSNSITCPFYISNLHKSMYSLKSSRKANILNLLPGTDIFLPESQGLPDFQLEAGIISDSKDIAEKHLNFSTYHKIGVGETNDFFDFNVNVANMTPLYKRYEKIVLAATVPTVISQLFFDGVYKANKLIIKSNDNKKVNEIISELFEPGEEDEDMATLIKNQVKSKHTCLSRASRLMRAFKNENTAKILQQMADKL